MPRVITARRFSTAALFYVLLLEDDTAYAITQLGDGAGASEFFTSDLTGLAKQVSASDDGMLLLNKGAPPFDYPEVYRRTDPFANERVAQFRVWALPNIRGCGYLRVDFSDRQIVWYNEVWATDSGFDVCGISAHYSVNGGETFTEFVIVSQDPPFYYIAPHIQIAPLHNGTQAYLVWRVTTGADYVQVSRVDIAGTSTTILLGWDWSAETIEESIVSNADNTRLYWLTRIVGATPYEYALWECDFAGEALTSLASFVMPTSSARIRSMISTLNGTLLILESDEDSLGTLYMTIRRSVDLGVSFSDIDLTALMDSGVEGGSTLSTYELAINSANTIAFPLSDGTVVYSEDDGETWAKSAQFLPIGDTVSMTGV